MEKTYDTLNDVLVNLFRDINDIEEKAITSYEYKDLTNISLSEKGIKAYEHHKHFHEQMIQGVVDTLTDEELKALVKALTKLTSWFRSFEEN